MTEQLSIVAEAKNRAVCTPAELKSLREAAGLSIPGTAGQLRLAARQVEALESGEWEKLPGIAFIKGALRSYGRLLSADLSPLIADIDQQLGQSELKADRTLERKMPERSALGFGEGGKGNKWAWVGLALIGLAAMALFFGQGLEQYIPKQFIPPSKVMDLGKEPGAGVTASGSGSSASAPVSGAQTQSNAAQSAPASSAVAEPANNEALKTGNSAPSTVALVNPSGASLGASSGPASGPASPAGAASEQNKPTDQKTSTFGGTGPAGTQSGETQYQINFAKDSWVEIKDASDERVLYGTQAAGTFQVLKGKAPYSAVIGNAVHVKIEKKESSGGASGVDLIVPMPKDLPQGIARLTIR
jgi:cytoskeleton protein RodZ